MHLDLCVDPMALLHPPQHIQLNRRHYLIPALVNTYQPMDLIQRPGSMDIRIQCRMVRIEMGTGMDPMETLEDRRAMVRQRIHLRTLLRQLSLHPTCRTFSVTLWKIRKSL